RVGSTVLYTLDGALVSERSAMLHTVPLTLAPGTVFRYKAVAANALPSAEGLVAVPRYRHAERITTLAMDPRALHSDSTGIDTPGLFANNTRSGKVWERQAMLDVDGADPMSVGVRISGSGSRGLAKRSFKVVARSRYDSPAEGLPFPDDTHFSEGILRADASPHAFLRNRLVETIVQRHGLAVDVQPSTPTALYMNGRYWGLYRWMPPKDAAWAKAVSGAEAVDVLSGPGHTPISGSAGHFLHARDALMRGAPMDSLEAWIDLNSLVDLACVDLWTGRADHDLNVRCYRPRQPGGRWRWILFDMDLWSPPEENSVERMCSASGPEAPYLPQLLDHPELQERLLSRMTVLHATAFARSSAGALADSIHAAHEAELLADHIRWDKELHNPTPSVVQASMQHFIAERPKHLMEHLAEHSGRELRSVVIEVPSPGEGMLYLNGCALPPGKQRIRCFSGVAMELKALPAEDSEFVAWKGVPGNGPSIRVDLARHTNIKVHFRTLVP
ncbi:MAG: CotH kinase family protein, partial [Flavobacteriales bacterium]